MPNQKVLASIRKVAVQQITMKRNLRKWLRHPDNKKLYIQIKRLQASARTKSAEKERRRRQTRQKEAARLRRQKLHQQRVYSSLGWGI
jgi:hypothetical protein